LYNWKTFENEIWKIRSRGEKKGKREEGRRKRRERKKYI